MPSLDELDQQFANALKRIPEAKKKFLTDLGNTVQTKVEQNINAVGEKTGKLKDSVIKVQKDGYVAVKPSFSTAPHTHLVENGHRNISRGPHNKGEMVKKGARFIEGKHMYKNAYNDSLDEVERKTEEIKRQIVSAFGGG